MESTTNSVPWNMTQVSDHIQPIVDQIEVVSSPKAFIEANTIASSLVAIKREHTIPVFVKDNEPVISHADFIETTINAVV